MIWPVTSGRPFNRRYNANAHELWQEEAPTIQETRVHAKCLRSLPLVRNYFRNYRAKKKTVSMCLEFRTILGCYPVEDEEVGRRGGGKECVGWGWEGLGRFADFRNHRTMLRRRQQASIALSSILDTWTCRSGEMGRNANTDWDRDGGPLGLQGQNTY